MFTAVGLSRPSIPNGSLIPRSSRHPPTQMVARYYMSYTGMNQDEIEINTCRDNFMTPEEAMLNGLVDHVIGGEGDKFVPHSVVEKFRAAGLIDRLSSGLLGL